MTTLQQAIEHLERAAARAPHDRDRQALAVLARHVAGGKKPPKARGERPAKDKPRA